jgi:hypothetical protein
LTFRLADVVPSWRQPGVRVFFEWDELFTPSKENHRAKGEPSVVQRDLVVAKHRRELPGQRRVSSLQKICPGALAQILFGDLPRQGAGLVGEAVFLGVPEKLATPGTEVLQKSFQGAPGPRSGRETAARNRESADRDAAARRKLF